MRRIAILFLLAASMLVYAQDAPKPPEPTIAQLKLELTHKDVQIAQLKINLAQVQKQLVEVLGQQAQQELMAARKAEQDATPKPEAKK